MLIKVDARGFVPLYEQVKSEIRRLAAVGAVRPNDPLPSIRELASEILVNPNTVARAYRELEQEGLITTQKGRGSFLAPTKGRSPDRALESHLDRAIDGLLAELRQFGLGPDEIRRRIDDRLRRLEERGRKGASNG